MSTPIRTLASLESDDAALAEYAAAFKAAKLQLRAIWADLELGEESVKSEFDRIACKANDVWGEAVTSAQQDQRELVLSIDEATRETRSIQEELGQGPTDKEDKDEGYSSALTTNARYEKAKRILDIWKARKTERLELLRNVNAELVRLLDLLGIQCASSQA
eukprot:scaffold121619_cov46-Prasinocladus_malaysianus.AAC.1